MEEKSRILLEKYFKNNANFINVFYDLSYSQGSGAMIEFDLLYNKSIVKLKTMVITVTKEALKLIVMLI